MVEIKTITREAVPAAPAVEGILVPDATATLPPAIDAESLFPAATGGLS